MYNIRIYIYIAGACICTFDRTSFNPTRRVSEDHQAIGSKNPHIQAQHADSCTLDLIMALD